MSTDGKSVALYRLTIHDQPDRICMVGSGDMSIDLTGLDFAAGRFRPATPDGTDCPWPDEQGRSNASDNALDFAAALLRLTGPEMLVKFQKEISPCGADDCGGDAPCGRCDRLAFNIMGLLLAEVA